MLTKEPPFNGANHIQLLSNIEKHEAVGERLRPSTPRPRGVAAAARVVLHVE
jgi:hypothetical protein